MSKSRKDVSPALIQAPAHGEVSNKPAQTIRYGNIKVTIWKNASEDNGSFFTATVTRSWRDEKDEWHDSQSFNFRDLPSLSKAIADAHSWIAWQERRQSDGRTGASTHGLQHP